MINRCLIFKVLLTSIRFRSRSALLLYLNHAQMSSAFFNFFLFSLPILQLSRAFHWWVILPVLFSPAHHGNGLWHRALYVCISSIPLANPCACLSGSSILKAHEFRSASSSHRHPSGHSFAGRKNRVSRFRILSHVLYIVFNRFPRLFMRSSVRALSLLIFCPYASPSS